MPYVQPQLRIHQEFEAALATGLTPLYACVIGPQYGLHRYSVASEKASLGTYNPASAITAAYPGKAAGSAIETSEVNVWLENAKLQYYTGSGFAVPTGTPAGSNKIRSSALVLKTANGVARSAAFGTRDVAIGDYVKVSWTGGSTGTVVSKVIGFVAETLASVGSATAATGNKANQLVAAPAIASSTFAGTGLSASAAGTYDGLATGDISEQYTVTITTAGASGVAKARVQSLSGRDDASEVTITYASTTIGTRGVTLTITGTAPLTVNDVIVMTAAQAYTKPVPTAAGTYNGPADTSYIVQIVKGGVVDTDVPTFKVTTNNGVDIQAETAIAASGAQIIGNYGVTLSVTAADKLAAGDVWTITALAETAGAVKTLVLADKLVDGSAKAIVGDSLTTTIGLTDTIELPAADYTADATTITVSSSIAISAQYLGTIASFNVLTAAVYVEYRELLTTGANVLNSIGDAAAIEAVLGPVSTQNPLAYGVSKALANSGGVTVYFVSVETNDLTGYTAAMNALENTEDVYSIVPLTKAKDVLAMVQASNSDMSSSDNDNWRILWANAAATDLQAIYGVTATKMATIVDDASGTNYVNIHSTGGSFITSGVAAGDTVRFAYSPAGYSSAVVDAVISEDEIRLLASVGSAYATAVKIEIWRTLDKTSFATEIAQESGAYADRRVRNIWPDVLPDAVGEIVPGYYLCAALAGLRSGSAPHAPLTNVAIIGFGIPARSNSFTRVQLNTMAAAGTWIVVSNVSGTVYSRHQLTTDMTDVNRQEDSITTNLDILSRVLKGNLSDLYGRGNVSDEMIGLIRIRIHSTYSSLQALPYPASIGPQVQGYEITSLARDAVLRDRIVVRSVPILPVPLNGLDVYLTIQ